ncbi:MAG: class I SAM-dependent methyltransferase [Nitrospinae bacterium]|nr:class I SAM-dependent methyltransferase [Nitrospinota bacterium]MBI3814193.1 class I SAM-dependent methyltransferase [Nitrospinota bacterium]
MYIPCNLERLKVVVQREQFHPGLLGIFVNPFYFARRGLYQHIKSLSPSIYGKTLDIGCGGKPYKNICNSSEYIGLEIDSPENRKNKEADYFYYGKKFPFQDGEFDSVITSQVLEHIFNPDDFLSEANRVLKDGGILLISIPFVWDEHEQPYDYARYSSFGLKYLLENNGFNVIEYRKSINDIRAIFQLINGYIYKKTVTQNAYLNLFITVILMAPFNILGELLYRILPKNDDLYLDSIVLAKKKGSKWA